jgi:PleD family two-component response regulator
LTHAICNPLSLFPHCFVSPNAAEDPINHCGGKSVRSAQLLRTFTSCVYVDDDELLLQVAKFFLEASGWDVTCVNDPRRAKETIVALDPDMVLLDMMMPEMDGLQTLDDLVRSNAGSR